MVKSSVQPTSPAESQTQARAFIILTVSVVVTVLLYTVPHGHTIAYPLLLISTMVHELGHGVAALLAGGTFSQFTMESDASGLAHIGGLSNLGFAWAAAGGLIGPAVGAAIGLVCARRANSARLFLGALGILGIALIAADILVEDNMFGLVFVGVFAALCLMIAYWGGAQLAQLVLVFLSVQLALAVFSRSDYLFLDYIGGDTSRPSDVQQMADALIGPYWFWGGVCGAISVLVLLVGGWYFLRRR